MKSEMNSPNEENKEIEYPCLMQSMDHVILFTEENTGTCVWCSEDIWGDLGYWTNDWNMHDFSPFNGSITLSND